MSRPRPYAEVLGRVRGLKRGLTTGSCAQAAAKAAALALIGRQPGPEVAIQLPPSSKPYSGAAILVPVAFLRAEDGGWRAGVRKDAGDDQDITNGVMIEAMLRLTSALAGSPRARIQGGRGVGRVTRPGLPVKPGEAAINPTPRSCIERELAPLAPEGHAFSVLLEIPGGETLAAKTWNPRLGVEGGLSIIGTCGVVEPKSSAAFKKTLLRTARSVAAASTSSEGQVWLTPGYVGERYLRALGVDQTLILTAGDHIGLGLRALARHGAGRVVLAGHVAKLLKIAAGLFNTHSRWGDARLETLAALVAAHGAPAALVKKILDTETAQAAAELVLKEGFAAAFDEAAARAARRAKILCGLPVRVVMLDLEARVLGEGSFE